jgi:hypothetical protein
VAAGVVAIPECCEELVALLLVELWSGGGVPWIGRVGRCAGGVGGWEVGAMLLVKMVGGVGALVCTVGGGLGGTKDYFTGVKSLFIVGVVEWVR